MSNEHDAHCPNLVKRRGAMMLYIVYSDQEAEHNCFVWISKWCLTSSPKNNAGNAAGTIA